MLKLATLLAIGVTPVSARVAPGQDSHLLNTGAEHAPPTYSRVEDAYTPPRCSKNEGHINLSSSTRNMLEPILEMESFYANSLHCSVTTASEDISHHYTYNYPYIHMGLYPEKPLQIPESSIYGINLPNVLASTTSRSHIRGYNLHGLITPHQAKCPVPEGTTDIAKPHDKPIMLMSHGFQRSLTLEIPDFKNVDIQNPKYGSIRISVVSPRKLPHLPEIVYSCYATNRSVCGCSFQSYIDALITGSRPIDLLPGASAINYDMKHEPMTIIGPFNGLVGPATLGGYNLPNDRYIYAHNIRYLFFHNNDAISDKITRLITSSSGSLNDNSSEFRELFTIVNGIKDNYISITVVSQKNNPDNAELLSASCVSKGGHCINISNVYSYLISEVVNCNFESDDTPESLFLGKVNKGEPKILPYGTPSGYSFTFIDNFHYKPTSVYCGPPLLTTMLEIGDNSQQHPSGTGGDSGKKHSSEAGYDRDQQHPSRADDDNSHKNLSGANSNSGQQHPSEADRDNSQQHPSRADDDNSHKNLSGADSNSGQQHLLRTDSDNRHKNLSETDSNSNQQHLPGTGSDITQQHLPGTGSDNTRQRPPETCIVKSINVKNVPINENPGDRSLIPSESDRTHNFASQTHVSEATGCIVPIYSYIIPGPPEGRMYNRARSMHRITMTTSTNLETTDTVRANVVNAKVHASGTTPTKSEANLIPTFSSESKVLGTHNKVIDEMKDINSSTPILKERKDSRVVYRADSIRGGNFHCDHSESHIENNTSPGIATGGGRVLSNYAHINIQHSVICDDTLTHSVAPKIPHIRSHKIRHDNYVRGVNNTNLESFYKKGSNSATMPVSAHDLGSRKLAERDTIRSIHDNRNYHISYNQKQQYSASQYTIQRNSSQQNPISQRPMPQDTIQRNSIQQNPMLQRPAPQPRTELQIPVPPGPLSRDLQKHSQVRTEPSPTPSNHTPMKYHITAHASVVLDTGAKRNIAKVSGIPSDSNCINTATGVVCDASAENTLSPLNLREGGRVTSTTDIPAHAQDLQNRPGSKDNQSSDKRGDILVIAAASITGLGAYGAIVFFIHKKMKRRSST